MLLPNATLFGRQMLLSQFAKASAKSPVSSSRIVLSSFSSLPSSSCWNHRSLLSPGIVRDGSGKRVVAHGSGGWSSSSSGNNAWVMIPTKRYFAGKFVPMTPEEEKAEKLRVDHLTHYQRDKEERQLNREIARLQMLRGINTGELYTYHGRYKMFLNQYGTPLILYYGACWVTSAALLYTGLGLTGTDPMVFLYTFDYYTGFEMSQKVDPTVGGIGAVLVINELLEFVRLPFVLVTAKPLMETYFSKY